MFKLAIRRRRHLKTCRLFEGRASKQLADSVSTCAFDLAQGDIELDLQHVVVTGHSAGGQLALWLAARRGEYPGLRRSKSVRPAAAAGLAPIVDLAATAK